MVRLFLLATFCFRSVRQSRTYRMCALFCRAGIQSKAAWRKTTFVLFGANKQKNKQAKEIRVLAQTPAAMDGACGIQV